MLGVCVNVDNNYCKNIQRAFLIYEKIYDNHYFKSGLAFKKYLYVNSKLHNTPPNQNDQSQQQPTRTNKQ